MTRKRLRLLFLFLILLSFARLIWRLDAKNLWFDESLSLQRAESAWPELLRGTLIISDGVDSVSTTDQHPFGFFAVLGLFVRTAGKSEFALRFPALMAATLLIPATWTLARRLTWYNVTPPGTAKWAALLAAFSPFFLWYGQETRMYTLTPLLGVLSTYLLYRWGESAGVRRRGLALAYVLTLCAFLSTHFFAVFLLPVQAALLYQISAREEGRRRARTAALALVGLGLVVGLIATATILGQPGAGSNFSAVRVPTLARDLLNAFSLGPSADVAQMLWLDLAFLGLAVLGAMWGLAARQRGATGGDTPIGGLWLLPAWVLLPPLLLVVVSALHPAYMTARHMSLIAPAFLILVGAGVARLERRSGWLAGAAAAVLLAGMILSSYRYYVNPQYGKGDVAALGAYLRQELQPGDLIVMSSPEMLRLYRYYLPLDLRGVDGVDWRVLPGLRGDGPEVYEALTQLREKHGRIWLANAHDPIREWLRAEGFPVREVGFESFISVLRLELFLPDRPIVAALPDDGRFVTTDVRFGDGLRLRGYAVGEALPGAMSRIPVTLYWQAEEPLRRRYKYVLQQMASDGVAGPRTEREPYDGFLATTDFPTGAVVVERTDIAPGLTTTGPASLALQVYDSETQEKLPAFASAGAAVANDGQTVLLPVTGAP